MKSSILKLSVYLGLAVLAPSLAAWGTDPATPFPKQAISPSAIPTPPPPAQLAPHQSGAVQPRLLPSVSGPQEPPRDPTQPGPQMRDLLAPKPKNQGLPPLELKGRILAAGQTPLVLLAMDKHLFVARQGAEIGLDGSYGGMSIRVVEVTSGEVRLEIAPLGRTIHLY